MEAFPKQPLLVGVLSPRTPFRSSRRTLASLHLCGAGQEAQREGSLECASMGDIFASPSAHLNSCPARLLIRTTRMQTLRSHRIRRVQKSLLRIGRMSFLSPSKIPHRCMMRHARTLRRVILLAVAQLFAPCDCFGGGQVCQRE